jgi:Mrp family chromosome partitioning ATPase
MESTVDVAEFGQLRARIEATFSEPAILVVASAVRGDGKSVTAFNLAESLADADYRVLLVDANRECPILSRLDRMRSLGARPDFSKISRYVTPVTGQQFAGLSLADQRFENEISLEMVKAAFADMRINFDFVVIDAPPIVQSSLGVIFAAVADGTLLTLRLGRLPSAADDAMIKTLSKVGANLLGVTTVTPAMIKAFARRVDESSRAVLIPARHVTSRHTIEAEFKRDMAEPARPNVVS